MRALVQRVSSASVIVDGAVIGAVDRGLLVLLGIKNGDTEADVKLLAEKCAALRIFEDEQEKMNLSVRDVGGRILAVSQFTLYGDTRKGNRPSFVEAAPPEVAEPLYDSFVRELRALLGVDAIATGKFRAMMDVHLVNDGPVTVLIESKG